MKYTRFTILALVFVIIITLMPSCYVFTYDESTSISNVSNEDNNSIELSGDIDDVTSNENFVESEQAKELLKVYFLDVGQGDCILITTPNGKNILIDSGQLSTKEKVMTFLSEKGITEIEYAFFTHPHEDHIGAADVIINNIDVKNVYMPNVVATTQVYERLLTALEENDSVNVVQAKAGQKLTLDGVFIEILSPILDSYNEMNEYSIIMKITYRKNKFLFMGDAHTTNEADLIEAKIIVDADVLKIGHHGSNSSTSIELLDAVTPDIAIISCGANNKYGHPHTGTIEKLTGITTYRTDINGTIYISCDGEELVTEVSK
ncbi:MAG: hypothetical protein A2Y15_07820 [Clostridiales bacterium GWF2_36_10]|nr:MAG: hypothetical protein A2Y15_07820 [Clostridiales bacterium GWF2_36_10]HAN22147.1 MBL fold metallo-hydrolase [Clostridiales bacterium]